MTPDKLPHNTFGFVGGTYPDGRYKCLYRWPKSHGGLGFLNCPCAQFSDGSCVRSDAYPKFCENRDQRKDKTDRTFADRLNYTPVASVN